MEDHDTDPAAPAAAAVPAGWYPDGSGGHRWWDGTGWTEHLAPAASATSAATATDGKTIATLTHAAGIFFGFLPSLLVYLLKTDDPFVRHHSAQALNLEITVFIGYAVAVVSIFVLIGLLLLPIVFVVSTALHIMAAMAAHRGEYYSIPLTLRLVS